LRLFVIISIIVPTLVILYAGTHVLGALATRDAQIFELEVEVGDLWVLLEDCKGQLGVFYMPPTKEGENEEEPQI